MTAQATRVAAPSRVTTWVVVCLALFMALLDSTAISLALPAIRADLGAGISGLVWIADGYVLIYAALLLTAGSLGDRLGRAGMFLAGLTVFTAGSALCAYAPDLPVLVAGRVVQGAGAALVTPQTLAILTHAFPDPRQRARAFGAWSGVAGLALLLGPVLGGVLVDAWGWRSVFLVNVPVGVATILLGARVLPVTAGAADRPDAPLRQAIDLPGQALAIGWLGTLTFALIEGSRYGWGSALIVGVLLASAVAGAALLLVERRAAHPMLCLDLFRSRAYAASTVVIALVAFGMFASFFLISLFLQQVQGYSAGAAGLRFLPAMAAVVLAAPLAGTLAGRVGPRLPIVAATLLMGASLTMLARVEAADSYSTWWPWLVGFGLGIGSVMSPVNVALMGGVPAHRASVASATGETVKQVGALVGIAVLGALVSGGGTRAGLAAAAVAAFAAAAVGMLIRARP